jgi:serine phosphatase RsbU (regulator of sigma subunit)
MFEDKRLREAILAPAHLPVAEMMNSIAKTVQTFSGSEAEDDITLLVARGI